MVRQPHPKHFIVFLSLTLAVANFFQVSKRVKLNTRRLLVRTLVGNIHSTLPHFINAIPAFHSFHKFYNKSNNITIQDRREINNAVSEEADVWERGKRYSLKYFVHLNGKKFTIGFFFVNTNFVIPLKTSDGGSVSSHQRANRLQLRIFDMKHMKAATNGNKDDITWKSKATV